MALKWAARPSTTSNRRESRPDAGLMLAGDLTNDTRDRPTVVTMLRGKLDDDR